MEKVNAVKNTLPLARLLEQHGRVGIGSLQRLQKTLFPSLLTALVIAIALALSGGFMMVLSHAQGLASAWHEQAAGITLYLDTALDGSQEQSLYQQVSQLPAVSEAVFIGRDQGLATFREFSGLGSELHALDDNPLPAVIEVIPQDALAVESLQARLATLPGIMDVRLDRFWLQRLEALLAFAERVILALSLTLGIAVLLITGNTIRLAIENQRAEIQVVRLVGGTDSFIARPFLYLGIWYGLAGGFLAWLILPAIVASLAPAVADLAALYQGDLTIPVPGGWQVFSLFLAGGLLGWLGAWLSVRIQLGRLSRG